MFLHMFRRYKADTKYGQAAQPTSLLCPRDIIHNDLQPSTIPQDIQHTECLRILLHTHTHTIHPRESRQDTQWRPYIVR